MDPDVRLVAVAITGSDSAGEVKDKFLNLVVDWRMILKRYERTVDKGVGCIR
jgi:hypothetical protein